MEILAPYMEQLLADSPEMAEAERQAIQEMLGTAQAWNARKLNGSGTTTQTVEHPIKIVRFSPEACEALKKEGLVIYELTGQSIRSLREAGKPFWSTWHRDYPDFEGLGSRLSEVAFNPDPSKFFLPDSNRKTYTQQIKLIEQFSTKLSRKIAGVRAVLGEVPDYAELAFKHLDQTGDRLFGGKYNYDYTRTQTKVGAYVADVGDFFFDCGLHVGHWPLVNGHDYLWACPLVVPAENR